MFPFKTTAFSFIVEENISEIKKRLSSKIKRPQFLKWHRDYEWVGRFRNDYYVVEQAQFWIRTSFRPLIVFSVRKIGINTLVKGYYRLDFAVIAFSLSIFFLEFELP